MSDNADNTGILEAYIRSQGWKQGWCIGDPSCAVLLCLFISPLLCYILCQGIVFHGAALPSYTKDANSIEQRYLHFWFDWNTFVTEQS